MDEFNDSFEENNAYFFNFVCIYNGKCVPNFSVANAKTSTNSSQQNGQVVETVIITKDNFVFNNSNVKSFKWSNSLFDFSNSKVIVVHRNLLPGIVTKVDSSKKVKEKPDQAALKVLNNSPFIQQLRMALFNGAFIVIEGNQDNRLNDSLVYQVFNINGPTETHSNGFQALGIYKPRGQKDPITVAFNYSKHAKLKDVVNNAQDFYVNDLKGETITNIATTSPTLTVSPSFGSTSGGSGTVSGSGNYYTYNNLFIQYDGGGNQVAQLKEYIQLERTYVSSSYSEWAVKNHLQTAAKSTSLSQGEIDKTYFKVNNTWSSQKILESKPYTTNTDYSISGNVSVSLSPEMNVSTTFGVSWSYPVYDVSVTHDWSGYTTASWTHNYRGGSAAETSTYEGEPGIVISNTAGPLGVPIISEFSGWDYFYNGSAPYWDTGNKSDTIWCDDL